MSQISPNYQALLNLVNQQKQAHSTALMPAQPLVPTMAGVTPESLPAGQEALVQKRYAATEAMEFSQGYDANPMVRPTVPADNVNQQMNAEVASKAAALEKAAREFAHEEFARMVDEDTQKRAAYAFEQLSPQEQAQYVELAKQAAAYEANGYVWSNELGGYVHPSQIVR